MYLYNQYYLILIKLNKDNLSKIYRNNFYKICLVNLYYIDVDL